MDLLKINKKTMRALLARIVLLSVICLQPTAIFADTDDVGTPESSAVFLSGSLTDIGGHWGEEAIKSAVMEGYVKGYPDGTFLPDKAVTRAEFVSMVNRALQLREENRVQLLFTDVKASDWYYDDVAKASYARYINGIDAKTFAPLENITREEAAVMLSRFLPKVGMTSKEGLAVFPDNGSIESWAEAGVAVNVNKGYLIGHKNGLLAPLGTLTRAEAVTVIGKILSKETIVREDISVRTSGDILKDKIYVGDITVEKSVGEGDATFQNLSALSVVYINGGGTHTVTMEDSLIIRLVVTKEGTEVRVLAADGTIIYTSILFNGNTLVNADGQDAQPGNETFEDIVIIHGTVTEEQARRIAAAINEEIQSSGRVDRQMVANSVIDILGGSTTRTDPSGTIIVDVPAPSTGGGRNNAPVITSVTITGDTDYITSTLSAILLPADATATYQWMRSSTASGTYENIPDDATAMEYAIVQEDIGKFIKVVATGSGSYSGTKTSAATGVIGFAGGLGAVLDPYQIANWYHLNNVRYLLDKDYIMTANLSQDPALTRGLGDPVFEYKGYEELVADGWEPIGYLIVADSMSISEVHSSVAPEDSRFTGNFDGNNKIIKDLYVYKAIEDGALSTSPSAGAGLFSFISGAVIKDVRFQDIWIGGADYVGAIAGYSMNSELSNIHVETDVEEVSISVPTYRISGGSYVGGIVGYSGSGTIEDCVNEVNLTGEYSYIGGIVGWNDWSDVIDCTNEGMISGDYRVGGIVGFNYDALVQNAFNEGTVRGRDSVGGIVGRNTYGSIESSENEGEIRGYDHVGGIAGLNGEEHIFEASAHTSNGVSSTITACANNGNVVGLPSLEPETSTVYEYSCGGIAGSSSGTISESYNAGDVEGDILYTGGIVGVLSGTVENCYNTGSIYSGYYNGGIASYAEDATFTRNYNVGAIDDHEEPDTLGWAPPWEICAVDAGGSAFVGNYYLDDDEPEEGARTSVIDSIDYLGYSRELLRNPLTYNDADFWDIDIDPLDKEAWDFTNVWAMNLFDNDGLPFFRWEWNAGDYDPITLEVTMPTVSINYEGDAPELVLGEDWSVKINGGDVAGAFSFAGAPDGGGRTEVTFTPSNIELCSFNGYVYVIVDEP